MGAKRKKLITRLQGNWRHASWGAYLTERSLAINLTPISWLVFQKHQTKVGLVTFDIVRQKNW